MMKKSIIQYLWIDNWRCYKEVGFNFSSKYEFKYEKDTKELKVKYNENYCSNFFGDNLELTGIVGMNGSGKTSLLDFLIEITNESKIDTAFIIAFEIIEGNKKIIKVLVNKIEGLVFHNTDIELYTNVFFKVNEFVTVLYNYALTNQCHSKSNDMFFNLTTSYLLNESDKNDGPSLNLYHNDERKMQLAFIDEYDEKLKDFGIKYFKEVDVSFDSKNYYTNKFIKAFNESIKDAEKFLERYSQSQEAESYTSFIQLKKEYLIKCKEFSFATDLNQFLSELFCAKDNSAKEVMKSKLAYALLEEILAMFYYYKAEINEEFYIVIIEALNKVYLEENCDLLNKLKVLVSILPEMLAQCDLSIPVRDSNADKWFMLSGIPKLFMEYIIYFEDKVLNDKYVLSTFANGKFKLKINKNIANDAVNAIDFFDKYSEIGIYHDVLNFDYNMSSGEIALLSLYSRFYSLLKINRVGSYKHKKIDLEGKNILILLDEAEVLFHPEWQRKYIINILEFFKVIFNGSSLQLLIATHSPIILSDIPKQNVLLLSKNSSNVYSYVEDNNKETFASNIYTLFKNSFFLDESGIGGFAFNKLEWIIEQIHSENPDTNKILKYINLIGDPFIKDKLLQEYHYILDENEELSLLKKEKAKIEEKIAMLESEKNT